MKGKVVDLTHYLIPGQELYQLDVKQRIEREGAEGDIMSDVFFWSHVGTHVESPLHYLTDFDDVSQLPLNALMGPAIVLDFCNKKTNEPITLEDFKNAGDIKVGDRILLMTGRDNLYRTKASHDRPYVSEEAGHWLIEDRKIKCLGTDCSGFEVRGIDDHPLHRIFFTHKVPVIECMANLTKLKMKRVFLIALPLPIKGLDACPVRAVAIESDDVNELDF